MKWALIMFLMMTGPAVGQGMDGNVLLDRCRSGDLVPKSLCAGYITGVNDGARFGYATAIFHYDRDSFFTAGLDRTVSRRIEYCLPENSTVRQTVDVVVDFLARNPQRRHEPGSVLIIDALKNAFPCQ